MSNEEKEEKACEAWLNTQKVHEFDEIGIDLVYAAWMARAALTDDDTDAEPVAWASQDWLDKLGSSSPLNRAVMSSEYFESQGYTVPLYTAPPEDSLVKYNAARYWKTQFTAAVAHAEELQTQLSEAHAQLDRVRREKAELERGGWQ